MNGIVTVVIYVKVLFTKLRTNLLDSILLVKIAAVLYMVVHPLGDLIQIHRITHLISLLDLDE